MKQTWPTARPLHRRSGNVPKPFTKPLTVDDRLTVAEFSDLFGFPASAVLAAIERNRQAVNRPFYSIPDLAKRWTCSRATVYNVLHEAEFKLLDLRRAGRDKGKWSVPAAVVEHIEQSRMRVLPEAEATAMVRAA
jgi:hypothetical protein